LCSALRFSHTLRELSAPPSRPGLQLSACAAAMMMAEGTAVTEEEATGEQNPPLPRTVGGARLAPAPYPPRQRCSTSGVHGPRVGSILVGTARAFFAVCAGRFCIHATVPPLVPSARDPAPNSIGILPIPEDSKPTPRMCEPCGTLHCVCRGTPRSAPTGNGPLAMISVRETDGGRSVQPRGR
jgi:hypothetical protein